MRLCLYNGSKKKKTAPKKPKKTNTSPPKPINKKSNNAATQKETSKSKKTDKKKKTPEPVEVALDPPALLSKLTLAQCKGGSNGNGAISFWKYVDAYTSVITKEDMNYLNDLTEMYSKENCPSMNLMPSIHHSPNSYSTLDIPDNWIERIAGALVDPDLFPPDDEGDPETKRLKLSDPLEPLGVFNNRSNFPAYLNMGDWGLEEGDEEVLNCDNKPSQNECDEIADEILKCQEELRLICRQNERTLTQLSSQAQRQLESQHLKQSLGLCENELVKLTQKKHKEQRLKKETVTSSTRGFNKDDEQHLIQRRESLLASLEKTQV